MGLLHPEESQMPDWILAPICLAILVGFIGFAFRQGLKVRPDRDNTEAGPSLNSGQWDTGGFDGHSGS
jgi:hypothetical protein